MNRNIFWSVLLGIWAIGGVIDATAWRVQGEVGLAWIAAFLALILAMLAAFHASKVGR